jgi:hypothetical protein
MSRPKLKTQATTVKMTPEVKQLWSSAAEAEHRSLSNMFEVMVRKYCEDAGIAQPTYRIPAAKSAKN